MSSAATGGENLVDQVRYLTAERDRLTNELEETKRAFGRSRIHDEQCVIRERENERLTDELAAKDQALRLALRELATWPQPGDQGFLETGDHQTEGEAMVLYARAALSPTKDERWACPKCGRRMASAYKHICPPGHAKDDPAALSASPPEQPATCPNACIEAENGEHYIVSKPSGRARCSDPWHKSQVQTTEEFLSMLEEDE